MQEDEGSKEPAIPGTENWPCSKRNSVFKFIKWSEMGVCPFFMTLLLEHKQHSGQPLLPEKAHYR
jgi:hypothetical protein